MASAFSFGFSGDDIDIDMDESELNDVQEYTSPAQNSEPLPDLVEAKRHGIGEWLPTLPSQISYNRIHIAPAKSEHEHGTGNGVTLARREIFDIRTQLMAEDNAEQDGTEGLIAGLEEGDIKPNFYEGGFKTWECALDLARLVVDEEDGVVVAGEEGVDDSHVIELGAGTAIPSLALFAQVLRKKQSEPRKRVHFTLADYNASVLRLVTLPNLLLTWNEIRSQQNAFTEAPSAAGEEDEELEITPEFLENFEKDLSNRGITVDFISGAWSPAFVGHAFSAVGEGKARTMILASETIYSPSSLGAFSETLLALLRRSMTAKVRSRALVAAKKVYFGVGGGVDEFLGVLSGISGECDVKEELDVKSEGVGRVVLEVTESGSSG